ncbi:CsbD family protein [Massilia sp. H6]|uniref:CsbD family protein n=1 Tax=Massilia sp. H6 TaxID=2970464 RepID=UPI0021691696|nr:CsbD family protein [Massilia sp. H6]UVW29843.1 CsbD family protein [Massilia sp. H6]
MNKDQVEGKMKDIGGKIQEEFGDAIDSPEQEAKGLATQVEGKTQKKLGDVKEALDDATDTRTTTTTTTTHRP